jgi:hypothetical protein
MEPTDLKSSPDDDRLDAWLRTSGAAAPLPDDGFTSRVLAALPPPSPALTPAGLLAARRRAAHRRAWFCLIGAALGCAVSFSGGTAGLVQGVDALLPALAAAGRMLATPSLGLAAAVTAASLLVSYWPELARLGRRFQ